MELPWFGVDCSPVKACRGDLSALPTSGCATSEKLRPGSGQPVQRGTGLCFTFDSVSPASLEESSPWAKGCFGSVSPSIGLALKELKVRSPQRILPCSLSSELVSMDGDCLSVNAPSTFPVNLESSVLTLGQLDLP